MKTVAIIRNAVTAQLVNGDSKAKEIVQKALSYIVDGAQYASTGWDGVNTFFDWGTCKFPAGFSGAVANRLKKAGYKVVQKRKEMVKPLGNPNPVVNAFPPNPFYAYQDLTVERLVEMGGMIAQIATGGGKSVVACKALARINRQTLFITTRGVLMHQMAKNFQASLDYRKSIGELPAGAFVGVLGDGEFTMSKYVNVATVQTLARALEEPKRDWDAAKKKRHLAKRKIVADMLDRTALLILEEAHESSGSQFYQIANLCRNADYRLALTATPFMKDSAEANMRLMAVSGSIGIKVTEEFLINAGILAKPYFKYIDCTHSIDIKRLDERPEIAKKYPNPNLAWSAVYQKAYTLGITFNLKRNTMIANQALEFKRYGLSTMTLVKHKEHGKILREMMEELGIKVEFIFGDSNQKKREESLNKLANREIDVLIGSTILDVGVDVPAVGAVILAGSGKAEVELRQRIGRGLRAKKDAANICFVVDFIDKSNKHLNKHSEERRGIVHSTKGFAEGILPAGCDFDYSLLKSTGAKVA